MKYIFLITSIADIGGGQKYCSNKIKELERLGYDTNVISVNKGTVLLEALKDYEFNTIPELRYPPRYYSIRKQNSLLNRMERLVGKIAEDTIIECTMSSLAEWGELLASKYRCKSVCMFLDEEFNVTKENVKFFAFKLNRHELLGTSTKSVPLLFKGYMEIEESEEYSFKAWCSNAVEDVPYDLHELKMGIGNKTIGFFGRLSKGYIKNSLADSLHFVSLHPEVFFNIIFIGGAENSFIINDLKDMRSALDNVNVVFTGFLNPVPMKLLKYLDVCIATAGCANVSMNEGVPTICVNTLSGKAVGILGYTVDRNEVDVRYAESKEYSIPDLLDEILFKDFCKQNEPINVFERLDINSVMADEVESQFKKINKTKKKEYYDISGIKLSGFKEHFSKIIVSLFGVKLLDYIILELWQKRRQRSPKNK